MTETRPSDRRLSVGNDGHFIILKQNEGHSSDNWKFGRGCSTYEETVNSNLEILILNLKF